MRRAASLAGLAVAGLLLVVLYRAPALWLWNAWTTDPYLTHGLLVAALAVGLGLWRARGTPNVAPGPWHALALAAAGAVYLLGFRLHSPHVLVWSLWAFLAALAFATGGAPRLARAAPALGLLALALPLPWTAEVGAWLQGLAYAASVAALGWMGVPVEHGLLTFRARDVEFAVTPVCSGFQSAVSLLALAAVVVLVVEMPRWRRAAILAAAVPLALLLNVVRILAVVAVGLRFGPEAAESFFHEASSAALFLAETLALLLLSGVLWRRKEAGADG